MRMNAADLQKSLIVYEYDRPVEKASWNQSHYRFDMGIEYEVRIETHSQYA